MTMYLLFIYTTGTFYFENIYPEFRAAVFVTVIDEIVAIVVVGVAAVVEVVVAVAGREAQIA